MRLSGARVWITGASSGIGEALVEALLREGARVAITARRQEALERVAATYQAAERPILVVPADVTDAGAVHRAVARIEADWGGIDLAVLNAGTYTPVSGLTFAAEALVETFRVNVFGVLYAVEAVLPIMLRQRSGRLAVTSSLAGQIPLPNAAAYGASKAAITFAFEALRFDLEPRGVGLTVIHPGFVRTPLTRPNRFPMPGLIDANVAASIIVRGLARDRAEIAFPRGLAWAVQAARRLPLPVYRRAVRLALRSGARQGG